MGTLHNLHKLTNEELVNIEIKISGYGTNNPLEDTTFELVLFDIWIDGKFLKHCYFSKEFLYNILTNSFEIEKLIETINNHPRDKQII